jgi:serine/threonine-protein kinase
LLAERYRLEERIGSGGMGEVWRAEHIKLRSPVAVKLMPDAVGGDEARSARFMREAQAAAAIRSTNVVHVLDYGVENGVAYIAMEYLEGESLDGRLERRGRLTASETARVLHQVAKAISRAHKRGIVHRDLKPANIFIVREEEGEVVKVLDFGIAKLTDDQQRPDATTQTGAMLGTPYYMSPEQARGKKVDHRSDLWALGVIAFECLTGRRPIDGTSVGDLIFKICGKDMPRPSSFGPVPIRFDEWFAKATRRDPQQRFQSAREMAQAMREALVDETTTTLASNAIESLEPLDSSRPDSLAMLDTLAAKKRSEAPKSDSWDTTRDEKRTHREESPTRVTTPEPSATSLPEPRSAGESLRDAGVLSRTASTPAAKPRARWWLGAAAIAAVGVALFVGLRSEETTTTPVSGSAQEPLPEPVVTTTPSAATAEPSPSVVEAPGAEASGAPKAEGSAPRRRLPGPRPSAVPKPAPGRSKIDFGI